ncbi:MAG: TCP-1/cpn60 chaperonin family protein [Candidatus Altiarchaeales archaeon]|nr:TCP-1/cpn60 chaperonin family protein [Candidatus Altiarchaeota archaeon]MBU4437822.1 TCP-1/cpn60 chaperonin family protein [Candidatus Altiarchaeota archaeon]MCG2783118.1 TCP-1/cpn60 chaperonin family protein [Candidatus Altiarchaeales archaeon]
MANYGGQPIFILPEGALRTTGRDAQRQNIMAGRAVAESVRTTLGPRGMDKMLVDDLGDIVITNDGATIVEEMNVEHPAAKMVVEVAKTQDDEVGDGTTTAVVITGELLGAAERLLDKGIHPSVIARGYRMASEKADEILNAIGKDISMDDEKLLREIAITAMTGKGAEISKDMLADLSVKAIRQIAEKENGKITVDLDNVKVEKKGGGSVSSSELIQGIIIDKERVHTGMPKKVSNAKIALLDAAVEIKETETDAKIQITDPDQLQKFVAQEENMLREMVDSIVSSGATVVFCQKGIDDLAQHFLSKKGIFAVRRAKKSDMEKLAKATGASIVTNLKDLESKDLGYAKDVEERKISGDEMIFVSGCKNPKAVSFLVRGGTEHVVDEVERAVNDALGGVAAAIEIGKVVAGGGAPEVELARKLREYADSVGGREQLAIGGFADAVEIIPRTLAESAGMDAIDTLVKLKSEHDKGKTDTGIMVQDAKTGDMWKANVIEPLKIKTQAIKSASEAAIMILRIDDVIASTKKGGMPPMPDGGMPGMM